MSNQLVPLPVVIPFLTAATLAGFGKYLNRRVIDLIAISASIAVLVICCMLVRHSAHGTIVYWFGNWRPDATHFPVGICFAVEPMGAGLASLVALLMVAAFAFSWSYFESINALYHALMLAFLGAMCGLCLTGDLFNLFVWFELMTAAAVSLCGYKSEESWPLLGALNFSVVNTIGAFLSLGGVAILYAHTGSLNMASVRDGLAAHPPSAMFLDVAFIFVIAGFLVKMASVPFQFWLADAHAVAPTPVCVLFSGVMVELGVFAIARLYWTVFATALNDPTAVRDLFLLIGSLTAVVGAVYCFSQRHLKRLLAFSTISHAGLMVCGFALLKPEALAGVAIYLVGHGMVKGALFISAGILLHRCGSVDEHDLKGKGKGVEIVGVLLVIGALGLIGMPPFATFYGESLIHHEVERTHLSWLSVIAMVSEILTAAAVLRMTARIFLGWGDARDASSRGAPHIPMDQETAGRHDKTPAFMWLPAVVLLLLAASIAMPVRVRSAVAAAAAHFEDTQNTASVTLENTADIFPPQDAPAAELRWENVFTLAAAVVVALLSLFPNVLGKRFNWTLSRGIVAGMRPLHVLQSGDVRDYVAWFAVGMAVYGTLFLSLHH